MAGPRPTAGQISAMTPDDKLREKKIPPKKRYLPPEFVRGATAKKPEKNRVTSNVSILGARACPRINNVYPVMATTKIGLRPTNSLPGPQNDG